MNQFLKGIPYTGNKYKQLEFLYKHFPQNINNFYDVFCGGLSVSLNVLAKNIFCNDNNSRLIEMYQRIAQFNYRVLNEYINSAIEINQLSNSNKVTECNKLAYYKYRELYNNTSDSNYYKPIMLFILICHSYNNHIRFNNSGGFNLPFGKRTYNKSIAEDLKQIIIKIHRHEIFDSQFKFCNQDFSFLENVQFEPEDFLYLDPAYLLTKATYNKNWTNTQEENLYRVLNQLCKRNVKFALSNIIEIEKGIGTNAERIINTFLLNFIKNNNLKVVTINSNYNSCNSKKQKTVTKEILVMNY